MGCGPDPNAQLPGAVSLAKTGGTTGNGGTTTSTIGAGGAGGTTYGNGGSVGSGGTQGGAGGINPFFGGTTGSAGGIVSSGGTAGSGGLLGSGGVVSTGGIVGNGGVVGAGGTSTGSTTYTWGVGPEPCASPKDFSCAGGSGNTQNFNTTTEFCFRTADIIAGWSCNNLGGWTMKINGQTVACTSGPITSSTLPPALNGLYYFDFVGSSSSVTWASLSWYANTGNCKAPPYPSWSGGTTTSTSDAGTGSGG